MKLKALLLFLLISSFGCAQNKKELPDGFSYVKSNIPTIQIELRYYGSHNFVGKPVDGYHDNVAILSSKATAALKKVQEELQAYNLSIKIFDSYRPQRAVNQFVRWARVLKDTINKHEFYPDVKKQDLFKEGYIASKSGHSRGSTLDITLVDAETSDELDMGSAWDYFGPESWVENKELTAQQLANRMLLQTIMRKHGFRHYPKEWWHFTLINEPFSETYFDFVVK